MQQSQTAEWLSKTMGQETVEYGTESRGTSSSLTSAPTRTRGVSQQFTGRSLLNPDEVMRIGESQQILLVKGMPPVGADKFRYFEDREFKRYLRCRREAPRGFFLTDLHRWPRLDRRVDM